MDTEWAQSGRRVGAEWAQSGRRVGVWASTAPAPQPRAESTPGVPLAEWARGLSQPEPRHRPPASPQTRPLMCPGWLCPRGLGVASGRVPHDPGRTTPTCGHVTVDGRGPHVEGAEQVPGTDCVQGSRVNWDWRARGHGHTRFFTTSPCESPEWPPLLDCLSAVTGACQESHIGFCL